MNSFLVLVAQIIILSESMAFFTQRSTLHRYSLRRILSLLCSHHHRLQNRVILHTIFGHFPPKFTHSLTPLHGTAASLMTPVLTSTIPMTSVFSKAVMTPITPGGILAVSQLNESVGREWCLPGTLEHDCTRLYNQYPKRERLYATPWRPRSSKGR